MDTATVHARQSWLRLCFFVFETGLLTTFLMNEVLPRWYRAERLGIRGRGGARLFWSHLFNRIYHLDGPRPQPVYSVVYWVSLAAVAVVGVGLWRRERALALFGLVTGLASCWFTLYTSKF